MKKLLFILIAFSTLSCGSREDDPIIEAPVSTAVPGSYLGKWKASHIQIMDNSGTGYIGTANDYYVEFKPSNQVDIKSPNGIFSGTATYSNGGQNDIFTVTGKNNNKVIMNIWNSTTYPGSKQITLNYSNLGGGEYNYNFIAKK